jgi:abortive infection bacteriophage resistance protein
MKLDRRTVYERLKEIKTLRNRIAHHNRIIGRKKPVETHYRETLEAIGWFSPTMRTWVEQTNR